MVNMANLEAAEEKTAPSSRFAGLGRWSARLILLLLFASVFIGLAQRPAPVPTATGSQDDRADVALYERVIEGVRSGGDYYEVAAAEHRGGGYPLRPSVTVRLPTLAWSQAALPHGVTTFLLYALLGGVLAAWAAKLFSSGYNGRQAVIGTLLLLSGCATLLLPDLIVWHETWAALLIALSLGLHSARRYGAAVAAGLAAALIREQAILYPLIMGAAALRDRRWREASAWGGAVLVFGGFLAWHWAQVASVVRAGDLVSPGWSGAGGWGAAVTMVQLTGPLRVLPYWLAALALPLALIGWAGWRGPNGGSGALLLGAMLLMLAAMARPDNFYWAFLIAPLVPLGLLFLPRALADLAAAAAGRPSAPALST